MSFEIIVKGETLEEVKCKIAELTRELILDREDCEVEVVNKAVTKEENVKAQASVTPLKDAMIENSKPAELIVTPTVVEDTPYAAQPVTVEKAIIDAGGEIDAEGLPWDKRIHSSGKSLSKSKGTWNKRRSVDPDLVAQVEAELRDSMHKLNTSAPELTPVLPVAVSGAASTNLTPVQPIVEVAPIVQPIAPPQPAMSNGHSLETFKANFIMVMNDLINQGKLTAEYIETLKNHFGVSQIWEVSEPQQEEMFNSFVAWKFIQKVM